MTAPRPLTATYRVQLNRDFTLADARGIVAYLDRLGISHLYASPILRARPGSMHGYDVADPREVSPELGGDAARRALVAELRGHGMGLVLDIVPNHMGVGPANPFWQDVLTHGRASRWASWFDIDWQRPERDLHERVLLPVLGDELRAVIERGELTLDASTDPPRLRYFDRSWPVDPATIPAALGDAWRPGDPVDAGALRRLVDAQHYALCAWRRGTRDLNYRRFFDVADLVGVRQEDAQVFEATHALILDWVAAGEVDALRVDHIDGLADPLGYLRRLRDAVQARRPSVGGQALPLFVEKILSPGERLRVEWPVQGTTGYEFLNDLESVFVDPAGRGAIEAVYRRVLRVRAHRLDFAEVAWRARLHVLHGLLAADVATLARRLLPIVRHALGGGPATRRAAVADTIVQTLARFPVYRTYVDWRPETPTDADREVIEQAVARVRARPGAPPAILDLLRDVLLKAGADALPDEERAARLAFLLRFQQVSGPVAAKGVEDTALYAWVPLVSLNEVGGAPDRPLDGAVPRLHQASAERGMTWPLSLIAVDTHDTKRSADVRARLDALSETPAEWGAKVGAWRRMAREWRAEFHGEPVPDANTEYLLYQTLVGIWPLDAASADEAARAIRERVERYMRKAAREAKMKTRWTDPDQAFEKGLERFIRTLLEGAEGSVLRADLARFACRLARCALWTSLSRAIIHLTSPGTPDIYQGEELWRLALVDPDNRRPVDFALRDRMLGELEARFGTVTAQRHRPQLHEMLDAPNDGRIKLYTLWRLLHARRRNPGLFAEGSYEPLAAGGVHAEHVVAFLRRHGDRAAIVIAPRLILQLTGGSAPLGEATWGRTRLPLPDDLAGSTWSSLLAGGQLTSDGGDDDGRPALSLATALADFPVALLVRGA